MATLRSEDEINRIVKTCKEIERQGGDVLDYLRSENYISPKATWWRLQKYHLHRADSQIRSGKPETGKERKMATNWGKISRGFCAEIDRGATKMDALREFGYDDSRRAGQAMRQIKNWLMENDPDEYIRIMKKVDPDALKDVLQQDDDPPENAMLEDALIAAGKRALAESGTDPDPDDGFTCRITRLETKNAEYRYDHGYDMDHIGIRVFSDEEPDEMVFEIEKLEMLLTEIPKVIRKFRQGG